MVTPPSHAELLSSIGPDRVINSDLRDVILCCGKLCLAASENFKRRVRPGSKARYSEDELFQKVKVLYEYDQYEVVAYLWTSVDNKSRLRKPHWIGYIAATTDEANEKLGL